MAVRYIKLHFASKDKERVSRPWFVLLWDLHFNDDVKFNVNEGHRTMQRQRELVRQKGLWSPSNPTGAAAPNHRAPHIRSGFFNHAIDFDNAVGVVQAARKRGVLLYRPIESESWHVDPDRQTLLKYYRRNRRRVFRERRHRRRRLRQKV